MCDQYGYRGQTPPRSVPVQTDQTPIPARHESWSTLDRRFRQTGGRIQPRLPDAPQGTVHTFESRYALVRHFRSIRDRGDLYNNDPVAFRAQTHSRQGPGMTSLEAAGQFVLHSQTSMPHFIYLLEQTPISNSLLPGIGMARRTHTSTPVGHNVSIASHREAIGNAIALALDYLASISVAIAERIHHAVVIYKPPTRLGSSHDKRRTSPYHFVMMRPLGMRNRQLTLLPWNLATPAHARNYLL